MDRLPLLPLKCILRLPRYTTRRTPNLLIRRSLNQFQRQYTSSKLTVACQSYLNQQSSLLSSHNLRSKLFPDVYLRNGLIHACYGTKWIHLSGRCDIIQPLYRLPIGLASKIIAALTGRKYRNWLKTQPLDIQNKHRRRIFAAIGSVFILMFIAGTIYNRSHTQEVSQTGCIRFNTLTREQCVEEAGIYTEKYIRSFSEADRLLPPNHPKVSKVIGILNRLIKANQDFADMNKVEWKVYVVINDERNAFVLCNGCIFTHTAYIDFVENDDQLAFILAHEMAHALCLHDPTGRIDKKTSRMHETEADQVGLHLFTKAGYDTREGSVLWYRMSIMDDLKGIRRVPECSSTHPSFMNRVKIVDDLMPKMEEERSKCNCPPLPDVDPRDLYRDW